MISEKIINQFVFKDFAGHRNDNGEKLFRSIIVSLITLFFIYSVSNIILIGVIIESILLFTTVEMA